MTDSRILPGARARLVNADGTTARDFYVFFRELQEAGVSDAQIRELAIKLGSPDGSISGIPPIGSASVRVSFPITLTDGRVGLDFINQAPGGEIQGVALDGYGRVVQSRPVVAGSGITIDGTTDPEQIELVNENPNVMTALGDLIRGAVDGEPERLPIGTNGQVLTVVSGEPEWATSTALTNPMTTLGDIIRGGASGVPQRLGIGTNGQTLTVVSGAPAWATPAGGGDVVGPASATNDAVALFDGTTGKLLKNGVTVAEIRSVPQNSQSAAYTLVLADAGRHILHPSADTTARTWTIPANASVAFPIGTALTFVNQNGAGVITIAITTDTMRLAGAGTTGSRTLAANGIATALKITATEWLISGTGLT